jgi:hypothetical protein
MIGKAGIMKILKYSSAFHSLSRLSTKLTLTSIKKY